MEATKVQNDATVARLLRMIPRNYSGEIVNGRLKELYRFLKTHTYTDAELKFFEQDISNYRQKYDAWKAAYKQYRSNPAWESEPEPENPHDFVSEYEY